MTPDDSGAALAHQVLTMLLSPGAVVFAIYRPPGDAPEWAAELVGRRIAWTPNPQVERGADVGEWAMSPYPLAQAPSGQIHAVALKHLQQIELADPMPSGA